MMNPFMNSTKSKLIISPLPQFLRGHLQKTKSHSHALNIQRNVKGDGDSSEPVVVKIYHSESSAISEQPCEHIAGVLLGRGPI